jgi:1-acyl-sn-glycerol-3-phosphate acyltransferase
MSPWLARRWYDMVFVSSYLGFGIGHSLRVLGRRNMPKTGPLLVLANHQSFFDPVLVGLASRRYLSYMARSTLFANPYFAGLIRSLDAIPIDQEGFSRDGIQATLDRLSAGKCVLVFPEGERTPDGIMHEFKPGVTLLIKKAKCPVVPVGMAGAFAAWPIHESTPEFSPRWAPPTPKTIALSVGQPIAAETLLKESREGMLKILFDSVAAEVAKAEQIKRQKRG